MLRKFAYNKIFRTSGMVILFLLLLLFPASNKYSLEGDSSIKTGSNIKKDEVFLIDKYGFISRSKVDIESDKPEEYATKLLELLIIGGKYENKIPNGFKALLPSDLKINKIKIDGDNIYADLSSELYELENKEFSKALELITYNLTTLKEIKNVYITINGKKIKKEGIYISEPFTRQDGVNKSYFISNYKNVSSTTIYYLNKNNKGYYYVPVTKINNDNRDKIKIIIDELTSSHTYETNLMSFLNYNTKLLSYEIKDDVLTLNFNEFLFDDTASKSILEEVIYSISLSVRDNYDVNEVIFVVNDKEITKSVIKNIE